MKRFLCRIGWRCWETRIVRWVYGDEHYLRCVDCGKERAA